MGILLFGKNRYELEKISSSLSLCAPIMPFSGNIPLSKAASFYKGIVDKYRLRFPGNPIVFVAVSYGSRVALSLELKYRNIASNIFLSSVAGVFTGQENQI